MHIAKFTFNPFSENTYVLFDETKECIIVDPGMTDDDEDQILFDFIREKGLKPKRVLNTHCHIDHILGNSITCETYQIELVAHKLEIETLKRGPISSAMFGINYRESPNPHSFIDEGEEILFGNTVLDILFVPGHAPGHVAFVHHADKVIIGGDVLFRGSVGRVDLPGCNPKDLVNSIQKKLYLLPDDYEVFSGHGPETTIGEEKRNNIFVRDDWSGL